jgi:hypothetical protein
MKGALKIQKYNKILQTIWLDSIDWKFFYCVCKKKVLGVLESALGLLKWISDCESFNNLIVLKYSLCIEHQTVRQLEFLHSKPV